MKKPMLGSNVYDDLYTPKCVLPPILGRLNRIQAAENKDVLRVWECCDAGGSNITTYLKGRGFETVISDIKTGHDFLVDEPLDADVIVTNPPYSLKTKFLERAYEIGKPFMFLLPLTALEGITRGRYYRKHGISVYVLDRRVDFTGKKNNWFNVSWFWWHPHMIYNSMEFVEVEK